jgi:hypothetical protein
VANGLSIFLSYFFNQAKDGGSPNATMLEYTEIEQETHTCTPNATSNLP